MEISLENLYVDINAYRVNIYMTHVRVTLPLQDKLPVQSLTYLLTGSSVHHLLSIIHLQKG